MTLIVSVVSGLDDLTKYEDNPDYHVMKSNPIQGSDAYVNEVIERIASEKYRYVIIDTRPNVRSKLLERGLKIITLFPSVSLKDEYLEHYKAIGRGSAFLETVDTHWTNWINDFSNSSHPNEITIQSHSMTDTILSLLTNGMKWETMWFRSIWNTKVLNPDNYGKNDETLTMEINHFINTVVTLNLDDFKLGLE